MRSVEQERCREHSAAMPYALSPLRELSTEIAGVLGELSGLTCCPPARNEGDGRIRPRR